MMVANSVKTPEHHGRYILDGEGNPKPEPDLMKWADWYEARLPDGNWVVGRTPVGEVVVSTVFLSLDHNHIGVGPPLLYETMCRGCADDDELADICERYATREQAEVGHVRIVDEIEARMETR